MSFAWHEIRDHLIQSSSTLSFHRNFATIQQAREPLTRFQDPAALLDGLHRAGDDPEPKNLILSALIAAAHCDGPPSDCAVTILLLALWPGLDAIRRRSIWRRIGLPDDIASEVLARTTEAIRCLNLDRVNRIASTVLRNVERDMLRAHQREVERERADSDIDPDDLPTADSAADSVHFQDDLRQMIGADAALVTRVAIEGFSPAEVALEMCLTTAATRKRYQRATRRLRDLLKENAGPGVPIGRPGWLLSGSITCRDRSI